MSDAPEDLSPRQRDTLEAIISYIDEHDHAPTYAEIGVRMDANKRTVSHHVDRLQDKGWIDRKYHETRTITILHRPEEGPND
jgi:SOS-response transcriptional repressors (RecA-mediated autopeptidases)